MHFQGQHTTDPGPSPCSLHTVIYRDDHDDSDSDSDDDDKSSTHHHGSSTSSASGRTAVASGSSATITGSASKSTSTASSSGNKITSHGAVAGIVIACREWSILLRENTVSQYSPQSSPLHPAPHMLYLLVPTPETNAPAASSSCRHGRRHLGNEGTHPLVHAAPRATTSTQSALPLHPCHRLKRRAWPPLLR